MTNYDTFLLTIQEEVRQFTDSVATEQGDWIVKGFIDVYQRVYAMPDDTKVTSKVLELFLIPRLIDFGKRNGYEVELAPQQNFYPDATFISTTTGERYAVDVKSTYRINDTTVNGMTLGAFTGYFRNRQSTKNIVYPYGSYKAHLVLGVIYSNVRFEYAAVDNDEIVPDERRTYSLEEFDNVRSVIRNFVFFIQPKYRIASARPGSGNTRNIGSVIGIEQLVNGTGSFYTLGEDVYDDYWMNYLNKDMARAIDTQVPYINLKTYAEYKNNTISIDIEEAIHLDRNDTGPGEKVME